MLQKKDDLLSITTQNKCKTYSSSIQDLKEWKDSLDNSVQE